ncbi:hypothetical protein DM02DRAFT_39936 [Periconia macrospinosa]|uniref:Uncharacterized protein n=1 Tax=Periconia macrospinosa TaxID=97972 RepID=A0A2V1DLU5_9PLEO|nr:hypothetical protein DM02DRAFT_39936 [Periconia macrospinosa]
MIYRAAYEQEKKLAEGVRLSRSPSAGLIPAETQALRAQSYPLEGLPFDQRISRSPSAVLLPAHTEALRAQSYPYEGLPFDQRPSVVPTVETSTDRIAHYPTPPYDPFAEMRREKEEQSRMEEERARKEPSQGLHFRDILSLQEAEEERKAQESRRKTEEEARRNQQADTGPVDSLYEQIRKSLLAIYLTEHGCSKLTDLSIQAQVSFTKVLAGAFSQQLA